MALTETPPQTTEPTTIESSDPVAPPRTDPTLVERLVGSGDHQLIGRMFIVLSLVFGAANLVIAGLRDLDVASNGKILDPAASNRLLLNAPLGLLLMGILPLFLGIALCVVPKQLGSPAIAFHRAASSALWGWIGSSVLFIIAVADNGSYGGGNTKMARLGNIATGGLMVSLILASVAVAVTVLSLRPAGMTLDRVPFFSFSMLVASTVWILTLPAAAAYVLVGQISHANADTLTVSAYSGLSLTIFQPAIYAVFIPVLGILLDVVATAVGGRQRMRGLQLGLIGAFGLFSYGAWTQGHVGQSNFIWAGFCLAVFLPLVAVFGGAGDTLRRGKPKFMSPLAFGVLAVLVALLGVADGVLQVINTAGKGYLTKFNLLDMASAQYRLIVGAAILGALGGLFYWGKQIFGFSLPDAAGKGLAPLAALAVVLWGAAPAIAAIARGGSGRPMAGLAAAGALLLALLLVAGLGAGLKALQTSLRGDVLAADPWGGGGTLEWTDLDQPTVTSAYPAEVEPGLLPRRRQLLYGTGFVAGACAILILTLVGLYLNLRTGHHSGWLANNNIPLTQPNMQLITLGMSMVTMQWAVNAIGRDARTQAYLALAITELFGLAFVNQTWFLYTQVGLKVRQLEGPYFYATTGAHLAMVVAAMIFVALSALRALGGSMSSRHPDGISAAAVFWHVTAALYAVVWLGVYVLK